MRDKFLLVITTTVAAILISNFSFKKFDKQSFTTRPILDTIKIADTIAIDSLIIEDEGLFNYKLLKSKAHASYYANKFQGRRTASGQRYDKNKLTAAHRKLRFGTKVRVTNMRNGKSVIVTINDRGPFVRGRDIDLSRTAFMKIAPSKWGGELKVKIETAIAK
ncbi:MAG: septal ring lytic transglycosylase RlpA family protein [Flavobacterium sp.]